MPATRCIRVVALVLIGAALLPSTGCGKKKKAGLTIKQQLEKAEAETTPERQAAALLKVARAQLVGGDRTGAKQSVKKAFERISEPGSEDAFAPRLVEAAAVYLQLADKKAARKALEAATTFGDTIEDASRKAKVFADAGALYGDKLKGLSDSKQAKQWLAKATELAESVEERFRAEALATVALGYSGSGLGEEAAGLVAKLEECAASLDDPRAKAEALAAAASVQAANGNTDEAAALLKDAAASAKSVERAESKIYALLAVAEALVANGDTKTALALLKEADKSVAKVGDPESQKIAMDKVRVTMADVEKKSEKK